EGWWGRGRGGLPPERALALDANGGSAIAGFGHLLTLLGRPEEGIDRLREAMRLNPYHPDWYRSDLSAALYATRRYPEAIEVLQRIARPGYWQLCRLAACYAQLGCMDEARTAASEVRLLRPDFSAANIRLPCRDPA